MCGMLIRRQRALLLASSAAVVYTPQHEHFGIVPLEAMAAFRPVVAVSSGGPTESVPHKKGGYLCDPTPSAFADAYWQLLKSPGQAKEMGLYARQHVESKFSRQAFGKQLDTYLKTIGQIKHAS